MQRFIFAEHIIGQRGLLVLSKIRDVDANGVMDSLNRNLF
jgi:hypothetical protein